MSWRHFVGIFLLPFVLASGIPPANAQNGGEESARRVKGLPGVWVLVLIDENLRTMGAAKDSIQTDVELKFRSAGMRITGESIPGHPELVVSVARLSPHIPNTISIPYVMVTVTLSEDVVLKRDPTIAFRASVLSEDAIVSSEDVSSAREFVKDTIDEILNAWLTANPRQR